MKTLLDDLKKKTRAMENLEAALAGLQVEKKNDVRSIEQTYLEK